MGVQGAQSSQWDQVFEEIAAGRAFTRGAKVTGAAGGQAAVEVFNPAGSGKEVQIIRAYIGTDVAQSVTLVRSAVALGTLIGLGHNLLTGAFDSAAELRVYTTGPAGLPQIFISNTAPNSPLLALDSWGPNLAPAESYQFVSDIVASVLTVRFDWIEREA